MKNRKLRQKKIYVLMTGGLWEKTQVSVSASDTVITVTLRVKSDNLLTVNWENGLSNSRRAGAVTRPSENRLTLKHATVVPRGVVNGQHAAVYRDGILDVVRWDECANATTISGLLVPA